MRCVYSICFGLLLFISFGCVNSQRSQRQDSEKVHQGLFLWQVTHYQNPKSSLFLYGKLPAHLRGRDGHDRLVEKAFASAGTLALEFGYVTPRQKRMAQIQIQRSGFLPPGGKMHKRLSRATLKRFMRACQLLGISPLFFVRYQPWFGSAVLQSMNVELQRYQKDKEREMSFESLARKQNKKIHLFSSFKEGIEPFSELSRVGQDALLMETSLSVLSWRQKAKLAKLHAAYQIGDLNAVDRLLFGALERFPNRLIALRGVQKTRNVRLVLSIKKAMASMDERFFFPVDLRLLSGQMGLLQLLKNEGFSLKRIKASGLVTRRQALRVVQKGKSSAAIGLSVKNWFAFRDSSYGFSVSMPEKPMFRQEVIPTQAGNAAIRSYTHARLGFYCSVVGHRFPVHVSMLLRQPRQRARIMRQVIRDYLRKHGGKILRETNGIVYAGRRAMYLRIRTRNNTSEGYIFYYQGQIFWVLTESVGRVAKNDYRRKLSRAFFRSFRILPFQRR